MENGRGSGASRTYSLRPFSFAGSRFPALLFLGSAAADRDDTREPRRFPHEATWLVDSYWADQFRGLLGRDGAAKLTADDWTSVKRIFETIYGLPDIEPYFKQLFLRHVVGERERQADLRANMRLTVPGISRRISGSSLTAG